MDRLSQGVHTVLERVPTGTLPLSSLVDRLRDEGIRVPADVTGWIRHAVEGDRGELRILSPWRGPWGGGGPGSREVPAPRRESWVLGWGGSAPAYGDGERAARRLQEALAAWGRAVDETRPASVARWVRATREAETACRVLVTDGSGMG